MADEKRGFAGFDALVSDLSDLPDLVPAVPRAMPSQDSGKDVGDGPAPISPTKPKANGGSSGKWLVALIVVVAGLLVYGSVAKQERSPRPASPAFYPPPSLPDVRPLPQVQPTPPSQTAQPKPAPPPEPDETLPPVGEGQLLSVSQVRYCLAQSIRIDGARSVVNDTVQTDIMRFNGLIDDYNSRCSSFRYRNGVLVSVRAEITAQRAVLELKGASDFRAGAELKVLPAVEPTISKPPAPQRKPPVPQRPNQHPRRRRRTPRLQACPQASVPRERGRRTHRYLGCDWICRQDFVRVGNQCR